MLHASLVSAAVSVETARAEWERAFRQLEAHKNDRRRYLRLLGAVDAVTQELRTRVGQTFTLQQLVADVVENLDERMDVVARGHAGHRYFFAVAAFTIAMNFSRLSFTRAAGPVSAR